MEACPTVSTFPVFSAITVAVASTIQAAIALSQMRDNEQDVVRHWEARDQLRSEISWKHPIRRWRRRADVRTLIDQAESPAFRRRFWRVRWALASWVLLLVGSVYGVIAALTA